MSRVRRATSPCNEARAWWSSGRTPSISASTSPRSTASGVRVSCESSAIQRRRLASSCCREAAIALMSWARPASSSLPRGVSRVCSSPSAMRWAAWRAS